MFSGLGYTEMMFFGVIAVLLFGARLPEVARNFGRTYRDMRRKVEEFQREFRDWDKDDQPSQTRSYSKPDEDIERSAPKAPRFIPPPSDSASNSSDSNGSASEDGK